MNGAAASTGQRAALGQAGKPARALCGAGQPAFRQTAAGVAAKIEGNKGLMMQIQRLALTTMMLLAAALPATAQEVQTVPVPAAGSAPLPAPAPPPVPMPAPAPPAESAPALAAPAQAAPAQSAGQPAAQATQNAGTYQEGDVLSAAEDVFGRGAEGLADIVRKTFKDRGEPNGYIVGREAGGAFIVGVRYGSGTLFHKVEGEQKVHWTGPSVGFDIGGDGSKVFALVYNLNDTEDLYRRYPAAEGKAYLIGGFTANYLQRDKVVIVPIKLGVGWRLGLNAGYMKFSKKGKILPF